MLRASWAFIAILALAGCSDGSDNGFDPRNRDAGANGGAGGLVVPDGSLSDGAGGTGAKPNTPVNVIITADNAYGFGYGSGTQLLNYFGGVENPSSDDIFACPVGHGPEKYTVPTESANAGDYLYIIGYADKNFTQGVIAQFYREGGNPVYTGAGQWEACATGEDYDVGGGGPDLAHINAQIVKCNAANTDPATTSVGWVGTNPGPHGNVVFGETNETPRPADQHPVGNEFQIVCQEGGVDKQARWMWYDWDPNSNQDPFVWPGGDANTDKEFIIFRLGAEYVPPPIE